MALDPQAFTSFANVVKLEQTLCVFAAAAV